MRMYVFVGGGVKVLGDAMDFVNHCNLNLMNNACEFLETGTNCKSSEWTTFPLCSTTGWEDKDGTTTIRKF